MADRKKTAAKARGTRRPARPARRTNAETAAGVASLADTKYTANGLLGKLSVIASQLEHLRRLAQRSGRLAYPLIGQVSYLFPADPATIRVNAALGRGGNVRETTKGSSDGPRRVQVSQACSELMSEAEALIGYFQTFNDGLEAALPTDDVGNDSDSERAEEVLTVIEDDVPRGVRGNTAVTRVRPQW